MKLKDLLKVITHRNYKIYIQNDLTVLFGEKILICSVKDIKNYFDYKVLAVDENCNMEWQHLSGQIS